MPSELSRLVMSQINKANFPFGQRQKAHQQVMHALRQIRVYEKTKKYDYCPKTGRQSGLKPMRASAGRPKMSNQITYLISRLNSIWMQHMNKKTRLNRRGERENPFVQFAGPIMRSVGIYNVLDNLNFYRRYANRLAKEIDNTKSYTHVVSK